MITLRMAVLLAVVASPILAQEEKEKPKKAPEIHGRFVSTDGKSVTVIRGDEGEQAFKTLLTLEVLIDGKPGKLEEIPAKAPVIMEMVEGHEKVAAIRTVGPGEGGSLVSVDATSSTLVLSRRKGGQATFKVASHAKIQLDGKPATLAELKSGAGTQLELSLDRKSVIAISQRSKKDEEE